MCGKAVGVAALRALEGQQIGSTASTAALIDKFDSVLMAFGAKASLDA